MATVWWWFRCLAAAAVVLALSVGRATADAEILCFDALTELLACNEYLENKAPQPSADCCAVVKSVDEIAKVSAANRQDLCECFRDSGDSDGDSLADMKSLKAQQLPTLCHASDNIKFGPKFDCDHLIF